MLQFITFAAAQLVLTPFVRNQRALAAPERAQPRARTRTGEAGAATAAAAAHDELMIGCMGLAGVVLTTAFGAPLLLFMLFGCRVCMFRYICLKCLFCFVFCLGCCILSPSLGRRAHGCM